MPAQPEKAHEITLSAPPAETLAAVAEAAEMWGAEWRPETSGTAAGHLRLPVSAGLRFGFVEGELRIDMTPGGSKACFQPRSEQYFINSAAVVVLLFAALGALLLLAWPLLPGREELVALAPLGLVLALAGWFLVISRLETRGSDEFLEVVRRVAEGQPVPEVE